ncbi:MAG: phosphate ABC transporter substrate-binding protein PstS [Thermosulfidibacteraceae bacterium]|jgi:phosphate transport system substrate-binding protein
MKKLLSMLGVAIFTLSIYLVASRAGVEITGAGATFPYPLYARWADRFFKETGNKVNYQSIGSGGGIRQITSRTVDFGASDAPLEPKEINSKKLLQFPTVIGAVVITYNIPGVKTHINLDGKAVCYIYLGKIKKWNDSYIKNLNRNINLPDLNITPVHRSDGSGTTWIFTNWLTKVCPEWANSVKYGTSVNWPTGIGGKGNEGVANYIKRTIGAIGYVEYIYAKQNNLEYAKIKNKAGNFVEPTIKTIQSASASAKWDPQKHFYEVLTNQSGKDAYPIAGATFILVAKDQPERVKKALMFFKWAFQKGDEDAISLHYVPLPQKVKNMIFEYWKKNNVAP